MVLLFAVTGKTMKGTVNIGSSDLEMCVRHQVETKSRRQFDI